MPEPTVTRTFYAPNLGDWRPASGGPVNRQKTWRVVRRLDGRLQELVDSRGLPIYFKTMDAAAKRAARLNAQRGQAARKDTRRR